MSSFPSFPCDLASAKSRRLEELKNETSGPVNREQLKAGSYSRLRRDSEPVMRMEKKPVSHATSDLFSGDDPSNL